VTRTKAQATTGVSSAQNALDVIEHPAREPPVNRIANLTCGNSDSRSFSELLDRAMQH
jgi:hypothetical protein